MRGFGAAVDTKLSQAPRVSVCVITYNHEAFVAEALEGILAQRTTFGLEVVIGEDGSTDGTAAIVRQFAATHPQLIRARFNSPNRGMMANLVQTLAECKGQYIALLEGDDYWTDPQKLQRQVDFLDANPDYAICFHPVCITQDGHLKADDRTREVPQDTNILDLAQGNFMHTCSVMYRARQFDGFPEAFAKSPVGDYFLHMLNARFGRIHKLPQTMGVYRVHAGGAWSTTSDMDLKVLTYLELMIGNFDADVDAILKRRHAEVAFRALVARLGQPGSEARLERCLKYGSSVFAERAVPWMESAVRFQQHPASKVVRRLFNRGLG